MNNRCEFLRQCPSILLIEDIQPGTTDNTEYTHYSLLKTIENNFNLSNLGRNDSTANPFNLKLLSNQTVNSKHNL